MFVTYQIKIVATNTLFLESYEVSKLLLQDGADYMTVFVIATCTLTIILV